MAPRAIIPWPDKRLRTAAARDQPRLQGIGQGNQLVPGRKKKLACAPGLVDPRNQNLTRQHRLGCGRGETAALSKQSRCIAQCGDD